MLKNKSILIVLYIIPLLAMSWPIKTKLVLTSTFGESRITHFHDGLDLAAKNKNIYPMEKGKLLFYHFKQDHPFSPVFGAGNFVYVQHEKGYFSGYYHLKDIRPNWKNINVTTNTLLGKAWDSGHTAGAHLHFLLTSDYGRKSINALALLPDLEDENKPKIEALYLYQTTKHKLIYLAQNDHLPVSRNYPLLVAIRDPGKQKNTSRGIYTLSVRQNGKLLFNRKFDFIEFQNGEWLLNDKVPLERVFKGKYYYLDGAKLLQGDNEISIECTDIKGNKSSKTFTFYINRI